MSFPPKSAMPELLQIGPKITLLPVIHGSGQFALTVRRWMLEQDFDCIAVPLPESFRDPVEEAVLELPRPSIVIQPPSVSFEPPAVWGEDESDRPLTKSMFRIVTVVLTPICKTRLAKFASMVNPSDSADASISTAPEVSSINSSLPSRVKVWPLIVCEKVMLARPGVAAAFAIA